MKRFLVTILSALAQLCTHTKLTKREGRQSGLGLAPPPRALQDQRFGTLRGGGCPDSSTFARTCRGAVT